MAAIDRSDDWKVSLVQGGAHARRGSARLIPGRLAAVAAAALLLVLLVGTGSALAAEEENLASAVSEPATGVARTTAIVNALVDPNGIEVEECTFEYGTSKTSFEFSEPCTVQPGSGEEFVLVSAPLEKLTESTKYYFRIVASNVFGTAVGNVASFTTLPTAPKAAIGSANLITGTTATLHGSVNPDGALVSECKFEYGTSLKYESGSVPCAVNPGSGETAVQVHAMASGLTEHTTYFYRLVATNAFGTSFSAPGKFTTPPTKPGVTTEHASSITHAGATLNATVNPHGSTVTSCEFEYGTSIAYGSHVPCEMLPGSGENPVAVSAPVGGLNESTTYYFRIHAVNADGEAFGQARKFNTLPTAPAVLTQAASKLSANSAQLNATVNPDASNVTSCEFEWGTSLAYGNHAPCSPSPGSGEAAVSVSAALGGLSSSTTYDFRVVATNAFGTSFGANIKFTTQAAGVPPAIKKIEPHKGPASGGTTVLIVGTGFTEATQVMFGSQPAVTFTVESGNKIKAVTPAESSGSVQVTVTTLVGTSPETTKAVFKFAAPTVTSVSPNGGSVAGGTMVTVTGSGFALGSGTEFRFGLVAASSVECLSTSECTVVAPAHAAGTVHVRAVVGKAVSAKNPPGDEFTYS